MRRLGLMIVVLAMALTATGALLANQTPVADAGPDQTLYDNDGSGAESVTLDGSESFDPGGAIVTYQWTEDGNPVGTGASITITQAVGAAVYRLTVTDGEGASSGDDITVTVNPDRHLDKVVFHSHLDGPDGATTATDISASNHTLLFEGNAQIDIDQSQTGGASALFDIDLGFANKLNLRGRN